MGRSSEKLSGRRWRPSGPPGQKRISGRSTAKGAACACSRNQQGLSALREWLRTGTLREIAEKYL